MQVSIETINNTPVTVIRRPFNAEAVRQSLMIGVPVVVDCPLGRVVLSDRIRGVGAGWNAWIREHRPVHTLTILPALPKRPTPEDAGLLYRYMSAGLYPAQDMGKHARAVCRNAEQVCDAGNFIITHAVDKDGNRVEIAIEGENNG